MVKAKKSELTKSLEKRWRVLSRAVERQRRRAVAALAMYEEARNEHYRLVKSKDWALGTCIRHTYTPFPRISEIAHTERGQMCAEASAWTLERPADLNIKIINDAIARQLQSSDSLLAQAIRGVVNQA